MKQFSFLILLVSAIGCASNQQKTDVFNESDYTLVKTDSFKNIIVKRIFVYKSDTARKLTIEYWDNGNVMEKEFLSFGCDGIDINDHLYLRQYPLSINTVFYQFQV